MVCNAASSRTKRVRRTMRRKRSSSGLFIRSLGAVGALSGLALACLALVNASSVAQTDNHVNVASAGIASDIGFFLADKKGYFRAEGLEVTLTTLPNSPQMIGPLGMGQLDVGAGTVAASLYNAVAQGIAL